MLAELESSVVFLLPGKGEKGLSTKGGAGSSSFLSVSASARIGITLSFFSDELLGRISSIKEALSKLLEKVGVCGSLFYKLSGVLRKSPSGLHVLCAWTSCIAFTILGELNVFFLNMSGMDWWLSRYDTEEASWWGLTDPLADLAPLKTATCPFL